MDEGSFGTNFELSSPFHCSISKLETKSLTGNQTRDRMLSSNSTTTRVHSIRQVGMLDSNNTTLNPRNLHTKKKI